MPTNALLGDIEVVTDNNLPIHPTKVVINQRFMPFIEYTDSDLSWLMYFGWAKRVEDTSRYNIIRIGMKRTVFVMHPLVFARIQHVLWQDMAKDKSLESMGPTTHVLMANAYAAMADSAANKAIDMLSGNQP